MSATATAGLNPQTDMRIVVTGEPAQTAVLIRRGEVKILSQFDTYFTQIERAGPKLRRIPDPELKRFPSNGFVALESTIEKRRADLVNFASHGNGIQHSASARSDRNDLRGLSYPQALKR